MAKQQIEYQMQTIFGKCPSKSLLDISQSYLELQNVWKVGELFGISGQSVHSILTKAGLINKMNYFTEKDKEFLLNNYSIFKRYSTIRDLAITMNRTPQFISRKAKELGLTKTETHIVSNKRRIIQSNIILERLKTQPHPKGMLNKTHSDLFKKQMSVRAKEMWANPNHILNSEEFKQKQSDRMMAWQNNRKETGKSYNRVKRGMIEIGGVTFFARSSWEANIASYFQFLKESKEIKDWVHEPETFWFNEIKRGVRSYLPDFKIINNDDSFYYVEVKGWMDNKSKTKIKRMAKYHPTVKIDVIDSKRYKIIEKSKLLFKDWGKLDSDEFLLVKKMCSIESCENKHASKGYCRKHFYQVFGK